MPDPIVDELRRLAGPDLYRRNAFRVSGLLADADARTTRQVAQRLRAALEVGADIDLGTATSRDPHEIQAACDLILGDPRRRLVHEMFAPWGDDVSQCGCAPAVHQNHDAAVTAHSDAIAREQDSGTPDAEWRRAWQSWSKVVGATAAHLESRVRALDDRQLDGAAVTGIERELPRTLVQPAVDLATTGPVFRAGPLVKVARKFPQAEQLHRRLLETAAAPFYEDLEERRTVLGRRIGDEPADGIVAEIQIDLLPKLRRLDALLPPKENHRTSALHDQVAILLNNCAVDLMNNGQDGDGRVETWLDLATELAIDQREHDLINENRDAFLETQKAIRDFRARVLTIHRTQGKGAAQRLLRNVRRDTTSSSVRAEIDQMLAEISNGTFGRKHSATAPARTQTRNQTQKQDKRKPAAQTQKKRKPVPAPRPVSPPVSPRTRRRRRITALVVVLALIALGAWHWWPRKVNVFNEKIVDNAPVGTCLGKQDSDWLNKPTALNKGDCDEPHWGEVVAYVPIAKVPSPYPGDAQANALAYFRCGEALTQQHLTNAGYTVNAIYAGAKDWNNGKNNTAYENYAACVVHRTDGIVLTAGGVTKPDAPKKPAAVPMALFARNISQNAPIGTCVQNRPDGQLTGTVAIVSCSEWHWAQIFGYPTIYAAGTRWPGDEAVIAQAQKVCKQGIPRLPGFTTWSGSPDHSWWSDPKQVKYAYCLVHRADDKPFKGALK
ncbi:MAG TPA: septum formation family protein [Kribbella sp.]|nr:septum formation family protein [Kribbella sp.]